MDANTRINHAIIILFFENKMSQHKIRDILHVGAGRVSAVIKYYILNQKVLTPKKLGRPPKCTPEIMSKIEQLTTEDRLMSCQKIGEKLRLAASTVYLKRKELKFQYKAPKTRQSLTDEQISKRILFANSVLNEKIDQKLIVFSDESRFALKNDKGYIWYRRSENSDDVYQDKDKYEPSIMVFGAIGYQYKSKLILCSKNIDEIEYRNVFIKSGICETLNNRYGPGNFIFYAGRSHITHKC